MQNIEYISRLMHVYADDPAYTLSAVTFRMSMTSHSPEVIAVAVPCMNESQQKVCWRQHGGE